MKKIFLIFILFLLCSGAWADGVQDGWFQYDLDLQLWDVQPDNGKNFTQVRRAENYFTFNLAPGWIGEVMLDPAKAIHVGKDDSYLQYLYAQQTINKNWMWRVGQFKAPFSEEGLHPAMYLDTIERAQFNLGPNAFGDANKELGIMGQYSNDHLLAQFGAFSGDPTNQSIGLEIHEMDARLVFSPDSHFHFGGSIERGSRHNVDLPYDIRELNDKNGLEFMWNNGPWLFETEYVNGQLNVPVVSKTTGLVTGVNPTTREGWYAKIHYDITTNLEAVLREDALFPNVNQTGNGERDITAGFNYWIWNEKKNPEYKFQVNYVNRRSFSNTPVPNLWRAALVVYY